MTHDEFLQTLEERGRTGFAVTGTYINTASRIEVTCDTCGNVWNPHARELVAGRGCNHCFQTRRAERRNAARSKRRTFLKKLPERTCTDCKYYFECTLDKNNGGCPLWAR